MLMAIGSDHYPVITILDLMVRKIEMKPKVNFSELVKKVNLALPTVNLENLEIDDQVDVIEDLFKYSVKESTHKAKRQTRILPRHIMDVIRERNPY